MRNERYMFESPENSRELGFNELLMMGEDPEDAWAMMEMMDFADDYEDDDECVWTDEELDAVIASWS